MDIAERLAKAAEGLQDFVRFELANPEFWLICDSELRQIDPDGELFFWTPEDRPEDRDMADQHRASKRENLDAVRDAIDSWNKFFYQKETRKFIVDRDPAGLQALAELFVVLWAQYADKESYANGKTYWPSHRTLLIQRGERLLSLTQWLTLVAAGTKPRKKSWKPFENPAQAAKWGKLNRTTTGRAISNGASWIREEADGTVSLDIEHPRFNSRE